MEKGAIKKVKNKIYRKSEDFYTEDDLRDPDTLPRINLLIDDFDAKGRIVNPRAPCVVTTIDPEYTKLAGQQRLAKKFRMKTDILQLREITRKKFMIFATQQMYLEKQREAEHQEQTYKRIEGFCEFAEESLNKMESEAFKQMTAANEMYKALQQVKVVEEMKCLQDEHQSMLMQVKEVYTRFQFLLKLIGYFDEIDDVGQQLSNGNNSGAAKALLTKPAEIAELDISDDNPAGREQVEQLKAYMEQVVRPYLAKRNYLNADVWIKGYEQNRRKIFNYNRRLTQVALLNHIVAVVYAKFQKTYERCIATKPLLINPDFMKHRVVELKARATKTFTEFERKHKKDKLNIKLNAIIPVILSSVKETVSGTATAGKKQTSKNIETKKPTTTKHELESTASAYENEQANVLAKVEQIQAYLYTLLNKFDALPPELCRKVEQRVRRKMHLEKEASRRALVKQNRLDNWIEHFKKHELQRRKDYAETF